jgi:competence protein ComEA
MQQFAAWVRSKPGLFVVSMLTLGVIFLIGPYVAGLLAPAAASSAPSPQENDDPGLLPAVEDEAQAPPASQATEVTAPAFVLVYVSGAVRHPDVYELPAAARVKDAVLAAGGFADEANPDQINLADHVTDAQHILVPRQGETLQAAASPGDQSATDSGTPLNINTASASELESLEGIGQVLAQRILEYRTANGPFQAVEDLQKVKGISAGLLAKIAPLVTTGP